MSTDNIAFKGTTTAQVKHTSIHVCKICTRIYFSYAALYLHTKNKHGMPSLSQIPLSNKDRGRPKRNNDTEGMLSTKSFFSLPERSGMTTEIIPAISEASIMLYSKKDHPFIKAVDSAISHPFMDIGDKNIDIVFGEYLLFAASLANSIFFLTICKFVLLLRDGYQKKCKDHKFCNVEKLPDFANEMLCNKLESYFGSELGKGLCYNFCQWLFNNAYTTMRLIMKP